MKKTKRVQPKKDAMLEHLLRNKPKGGENFWVFSVIIDDPDTPTWDQRFNIVGTYEQDVSAFVAMSHVFAENGQLKEGLKVAMFQGDNARGFLAESSVQEAAYQQERSAQPNN